MIKCHLFKNSFWYWAYNSLHWPKSPPECLKKALDDLSHFLLMIDKSRYFIDFFNCLSSLGHFYLAVFQRCHFLCFWFDYIVSKDPSYVAINATICVPNCKIDVRLMKSKIKKMKWCKLEYTKIQNTVTQVHHYSFSSLKGKGNELWSIS